MTKSPTALAREALEVGREALPTYASRFSRKDFTQPQLFAIFVLKKFFKTDYRGIVALLAEWSDLRRALKLERVPDFSTLWHTSHEPHLPGHAGPGIPCPRCRACLGPATGLSVEG